MSGPRHPRRSCAVGRCRAGRFACAVRRRARSPALFERRRVRPPVRSALAEPSPFFAQKKGGRSAGGRSCPSVCRSLLRSCGRLTALHRGVCAAAGRALPIRERARTVSRLPAGGRSASGRSPAAARDRACEARPRAPHRQRSGLAGPRQDGGAAHLRRAPSFVPPFATPRDKRPSADEVMRIIFLLRDGCQGRVASWVARARC